MDEVVMQDETEKRCSFYGLSEKDVATLVQGPGVWICNDCIELCQRILEGSPSYYPVSEEIVDVELPMKETTVAELRRLLARYHYNTKVLLKLSEQ